MIGILAMVTLKLVLISAALLALVVVGLSLKLIFGKTTNKSCSNDDVGYSCGCGGSCGANSKKVG